MASIFVIRTVSRILRVHHPHAERVVGPPRRSLNYYLKSRGIPRVPPGGHRSDSGGVPPPTRLLLVQRSLRRSPRLVGSSERLDGRLDPFEGHAVLPDHLVQARLPLLRLQPRRLLWAVLWRGPGAPRIVVLLSDGLVARRSRRLVVEAAAHVPPLGTLDAVSDAVLGLPPKGTPLGGRKSASIRARAPPC